MIDRIRQNNMKKKYTFLGILAAISLCIKSCFAFSQKNAFLTFLNPNIFFPIWIVLMRNLQEQVKKAFCYHKLFWPFTFWINWYSDRENFWNSRLKADNLQYLWDHLKNLFKQWIGPNSELDRTIFETECFKLFFWGKSDLMN